MILFTMVKFFLGLLFGTVLPSHTPLHSTLIPNANHIFNTLHSSMRQWGSSLNYIGVSAFIVRVPEHTQLYHGGPDSESPQGVDWLAFEPEHALLFAKPKGAASMAGQKNSVSRNGSSQSQTGHSEFTKDKPTEPTEPTHSTEPTQPTLPTLTAPENFPKKEAGYLQTYRTSRQLRLLYLDGMSAAKTQLGTLDFQDLVLLNGTIQNSDYERAQSLCAVAMQEWSSSINGFIRMEGGFEIILCQFAGNVDLLHSARVRPRGGGLSPMNGDFESFFNYYRAITDRYGGIGGRRVIVDYNNFVTGFNYQPVLENKIRLLVNLPQRKLDELRQKVVAMVTTTADETEGVDWQGVVDLIITRWGNRIKAFSKFEEERLREELRRSLDPFIDYDNRNPAAEAERCARQFLPMGKTGIAALAVSEVSSRICSTLFDMQKSVKYEEIIRDMQDMIKYLDWSIWKECDSSCKAEEVCYVAIWPWSSLEKDTAPKCRSELPLPFED